MLMESPSSARCRPHFILGLCARTRVYAHMWSSDIPFLPHWASWPHRTFAWDRRGAVQAGLWFISNRDVELAQEGRMACRELREVSQVWSGPKGRRAEPALADYVRRVQHIPICIILNILYLTWDLDTQNTVFKLLVYLLFYMYITHFHAHS